MDALAEPPVAAADRPPMVAPEEYYAPAQGLRGVKLLTQLHDLTEDTHRPRSYTDARRAMFRSIDDPDRDDVVTELYSGRQVKGIDGLAAATAAGLTTEHVWPQSQGATEMARTDLHHLRIADGRINTHRSNLPFGEVDEVVWQTRKVAGVQERSRVGYDEHGVKVFDPRASIRGDLAREQFYFYTRYQLDRPADFSLDNFRQSLATLRRWHEADPVDDAERARNDAIARLQGNRNPYIDHPEFVKKVGFTDALLKRVHGRAH
jgi:endonuclease I